ncbi:L,D-transpeptidase family protein [Pigmentibacter ruber]
MKSFIIFIKYFILIFIVINIQQFIFGLNLEINGVRGESNCTAKINNKTYSCVLGKNSTTSNKKEGDLSTPLGKYPIRKIFYREDRIGNKINRLKIPLQKIQKDDGWCDDPQSPHYNKYIKLPFPYSHENLWRDDHLYDIILVIGYNDEPVVKAKGSAIFLHVKSSTTKSTAGCVAFSEKDLIEILENLDSSSQIIIQ